MPEIAPLRDERYTGTNRCWPCTVVNVAILGVVALALALRERRLVGAVVATVGLALVYLRGYLVPYTPRFAPALVAASPLPDRWFHDERYDEPDGETFLADDVDLDGETVTRRLAEAGVVEADGEMVYLADDVETAWHDRMAELSSLSRSALAAEVERTVPGVASAEPLRSGGREWIAVERGDGAVIARPVAVAELAAYQVLEGRLDDRQVRTAATETFRMFLERCPVCNTELAASSEVSCCGGYTTPRETPDETLVCPSCRQRIYRFPEA